MSAKFPAGKLPPRQYYRINYPAKARPALMVFDHAFEVLDLSERGIRFKLGDAVAPSAGNEFEGVVRFKQGATAEISGTILRVIDGEVAAALERGVPASLIRSEQRYLLENSRRFT